VVSVFPKEAHRKSVNVIGYFAAMALTEDGTSTAYQSLLVVDANSEGQLLRVGVRRASKAGVVRGLQKWSHCSSNVWGMLIGHFSNNA
jgi:hypothetical protein